MAFAQILSTDQKNEQKLYESSVKNQVEFSKLGLVVEYNPGKGIKLHIPKELTPELCKFSDSELRLKLIALGVEMLKAADIQGTVEVKQDRLGGFLP